jgi:hypothetical protein
MKLSFSRVFNFDEWMLLATKNPAEFERRRGEIINFTIDNAPPRIQSRLRSLQWRIDKVRQRSNPLSACIKLNRMMWCSIYGENGFLKALTTLTGNQFDKPIGNKKSSAKIYSLPLRETK